VELVQCANVSSRLLGNFNTACSTTYGGFFEGIYDGPPADIWKEGDGAKHPGVPDCIAKDLISTALSKYGNTKQQSRGLIRKAISRDYISPEVTQIDIPDLEPGPINVKHKYCCGLYALGRLKAKPWIPEDPYGDEPPIISENKHDELEIFLEKSILQYCFVGMHLEARVHKFDDGFTFMDCVTVS
jgi:hypothetical protein